MEMKDAGLMRESWDTTPDIRMQYRDLCGVLRKELEEYRQAIENKDTTINAFINTLHKANEEIEELREDVRELNPEIDGDHKKIRGLEAQINSYRDWYHYDRHIIDECQEYNTKLKHDLADREQRIRELETELSVREGDSEVLAQVVESLKPWQRNKMGSANTILRIYGILADRIDDLASELDVRNDILREPVNEIADLKSKLADRERQFNELDGILGRTRNSMLCANEHIGKQNVRIEELKSHTVTQDRILMGRLSYINHIKDRLSTRSDIIKTLGDKLTAREHDSEVLMKVVDVIKDDTIPNSKVPCMICSIVDEYLDAPEEAVI